MIRQKGCFAPNKEDEPVGEVGADEEEDDGEEEKGLEDVERVRGGGPVEVDGERGEEVVCVCDHFHPAREGSGEGGLVSEV